MARATNLGHLVYLEWFDYIDNLSCLVSSIESHSRCQKHMPCPSGWDGGCVCVGWQGGVATTHPCGATGIENAMTHPGTAWHVAQAQRMEEAPAGQAF